jgi:acetyl esterase/lipase
VRIDRGVVYGRSSQGSHLAGDVYIPAAETKPAPVVIIVHGGGFTSGGRQTEAPYAQALAAVGFVTFNVDYSLVSPGSRGYPRQVQEIQHAIQWTAGHASQFGGDPHRLALVGFSAGAYLSAMAGLLESGLPGRPVKAVVTLSAPLDLPPLYQLLRARLTACGTQTSCPRIPQAPPLSAFGTLFDFLGCPAGKCSEQLLHTASPSSHVTATAPAFLILNSANEVVPQSQATDMGSLLRDAGVPERVVIVPGNGHGAAILPVVSLAIAKFLGRQLGLPGVGNPPLASYSTPRLPSSGSGLTALVAGCGIAATGGLVLTLLALRKRSAGVQ